MALSPALAWVGKWGRGSSVTGADQHAACLIPGEVVLLHQPTARR